MKESDIRKYAQLMQELGLSGLEITEDNQVVRLERSAPAAKQAVPMEAPSPAEKEDADYISVKSPLVGLFYAAPAENADPYVSLGDRVKAGQDKNIKQAKYAMTVTILGITFVNPFDAFKKLEPTTSKIIASAKNRYFILYRIRQQNYN